MVSFFILFPFLAVSATALSVPHDQYGKAVAEVSNKLASDLYKKLSDGDGNVFFSPLSIVTALSMLFYGARGTTADEMRRALGYQEAGLTDDEVHSAFEYLLKTFSEDSVSREYMLYLANAVLTQEGYPILDEYRTGLQKIYKATARNVDFRTQSEKAVQEINNWVRQKTNNQITQVLSSIDPSTVVVLLNAIYFKGTWKTTFNEAANGIFFNKGLEAEGVTVPMMYYERDVLYTRCEVAQAIELPYKGEDISMVIVLPNARDGLSNLEQNLTPSTLRDIRKSSRKTRAFVKLPKFKLEYEKTLNGVLKDIGIKEVFESSADLSGINGGKGGGLVVSTVFHKAVIEVNEEGTEASGVTGIVIRPVSANINDIYFIADHPFLFAIVDRRNDLVLFQGRVNKF